MVDSIVNKWLLVRYLVIGTYVGCVTVAGFAWWYMFFEVSHVCCYSRPMHACGNHQPWLALCCQVPLHSALHVRFQMAIQLVKYGTGLSQVCTMYCVRSGI